MIRVSRANFQKRGKSAKAVYIMAHSWKGRRQKVQDSYFVSFLDIAACCQKMPDGMAPGPDGRISLILTQVQIP